MVGGMELSEMDIMVELVNHEDEEVPDDSVSYDDGFSILVVGRRCSECLSRNIIWDMEKNLGLELNP